MTRPHFPSNARWASCHVALLTAIIAATVPQASGIEQISIGELKLIRAFASTEQGNELREYLPAGETLQHWQHLASVRVFKNLRDPDAYLKNVAAAVTKSHPQAHYQVFRNTDSLVLDFTTFTPDSAPEGFAEWNLMRATYEQGRGLVVYQYAMRLYEISPTTADRVNAERNKVLGSFGTASFIEQVVPESVALEPKPQAPVGATVATPRPQETREDLASVARLLKASEAIAAAEAHGGVEGLFEFEVKGAGRRGDIVYLNSELDYRDEKCLTISIPGAIVGELEANLGGDLGLVLKGKTVRVRGMARRIQVWFYANGRKTDRFYFQTQVEIVAVSDLLIKER
jgi:hypothetical protein